MTRVIVGVGTAALVAGTGWAVQLGALAVPHVVVTGRAGVRETSVNTPTTTISAELLEKVPTGRSSIRSSRRFPILAP